MLKERLAHLRAAGENQFGIENKKPTGNESQLIVPEQTRSFIKKGNAEGGSQSREQNDQQRTMRIRREITIREGAESQQAAILIGVIAFIERRPQRLAGTGESQA